MNLPGSTSRNSSTNSLSVTFAARKELYLIALKLQKVTAGNGRLCERNKNCFGEGNDFLVSGTRIVEFPELSQ